MNTWFVGPWLYCCLWVPVHCSITITRGDEVLVASDGVILRHPDFRAGAANRRLLAARRAELSLVPPIDAPRAERLARVALAYWRVSADFPGTRAARLARGRLDALGFRESAPGRLRLELPPGRE